MRRFASVFVSSRRSDKSDASSTPSSTEDSSQPRDVQKKRSRMFNSLSRKHPPPTNPPRPPFIASDLTNSSSSSSSGSTTLRTPDDDGPLHTSSNKSNWKSWLGGKNLAASDHLEEQHPRPSWQSSQNLLPPPKPTSDDASSQSEDNYGPPDEARPSSTYTPQQMASAKANARTMVINSLIQQRTSPPLIQSADTISFPRSCHISRRLSRCETLESELHKKALLARLDRLSPSAERSIAPLASKVIISKSQSHRNFQEDFFPPVDSVRTHSGGLANWVARPYFEETHRLWTPLESGEIIHTRIPGSKLGVAAFEFSETLELLAGTLLESEEDVEQDFRFDPALEFTLPAIVLDLDAPATEMKEVGLQLPSLTLDLSPSIDPPTKSPSLPSESPRSSLRQSLPKASSPSRHESSSSESAPAEPAPKRGVRFADDDGKDDQIPLGYVLRIRRNKEQKARFLREERERRTRAAQGSSGSRQLTAPPQENRVSRVVVPRQTPSRPLVNLMETPRPQKTVSRVDPEQERLRREAERIEMEKLRRSRDQARKQAEERERAFAEELQATRLRREAARAGRPLESASLQSRSPARDRSGSRDSLHASIRRSSISPNFTPELVLSPILPLDGSPSSSLPPTPGSQYSLSRPPSLYSAHTTSSEDVRARDSRRVSRRMSMVTDPSKQMMLQPPYNPYAWTTLPPVPMVPPVPPIPNVPMVNSMSFYGMDMPLLPPSPPFMMGQYGSRPRSYTGSQGLPSPLQSSTSLPRNYSSEGVNNSSRNSSSNSHSSGSHQRRSSDDARMSRTFGDSRSGSQTDLRAGRVPHSAPIIRSSSQQRSSWLPPERSPGSAAKKSSSLRPTATVYPNSPAPNSMRRRTPAS